MTEWADILVRARGGASPLWGVLDFGELKFDDGYVFSVPLDDDRLGLAGDLVDALRAWGSEGAGDFAAGLVLARRVARHLGDAWVVRCWDDVRREGRRVWWGSICCVIHQRISAFLICYLDRVKLSEWASRNGVHYQTAWVWAKEGRMPVPVRQTPSGTWLVDEPAPETSGRVVAYCRVSSADRKPDLDRQVARVVQGATGLGLPVAEVVTEVGSGLDGRRRKLHRILSDPSAAVIVVEHRDRLAPFGVEHLEAALSASGRRLVVLDPAETVDDLVRDITEVLTSMCARLYGPRVAKDRAVRAVAVATGEGAG